MKRSIILSVSNDIVTDQRVLKMADVLVGSGHPVTIAGRRLSGSLAVSNIPYEIKRFRMFFTRGFLFYFFFNLRLFFFLLFRKASLLVSNDLDTLLPNYIVSRIRGIRLVYDSHEYFTGVAELDGRYFVKWVWKTIERFIVPKINTLITVNDSIAKLYQDEYGGSPHVVRNLGRKYTGHPAGRITGASGKELLLVFQGRGINMNRGGEELIDAVVITGGVHLMVIGGGDNYMALRQRAENSGEKQKFTFLPVMEWNEMMAYTSSADLGLSLDKPDHINSKFSLPNKIFDYIAAGIPVLASDLPEIRRLNDEYGFGLLIKDVEPRSISEKICLLRDDPFLLAKLKAGSVRASVELNWEREAEKVQRIYSGLGLEFSPV